MQNKQPANQQIEGIIFKKDGLGQLLFLLLKRIPSRGGFWQPVTGGVHPNESLENALSREILEETGIRDIKRAVNTQFTFEFNDNGNDYTEYVYGVEVPHDSAVNISAEHNAFTWATKEEAMVRLKWQTNKDALQRLCAILEKE